MYHKFAKLIQIHFTKENKDIQVFETVIQTENYNLLKNI